MTMVGLPLILFTAEENREWYEDDTISVTKDGVIDDIESVGTGTVEDTTIIVKINGVTDTTIDV